MDEQPAVGGGAGPPEREPARLLRHILLGLTLTIVAGAVVAGWFWFRGQIAEQRIMREEEALRHLGVALLIYSGTSDGALPVALTELVDLGLVEAAHLKSPRKRSNTRACHYFYIEGLTAADPPEWVVAFYYANDGSPCTALQLGGEVVRLERRELERRLDEATTTIFNTQGRPELTVHPPE